MHRPQVSVVMSVFNGADHLRMSVQSILSQSFGDLELIIINDGSTDETPSILQDYSLADPRVRVIEQDNSGLGHALHRGCEMAQGKWIARQDVDDLSLPGRIAKQVAFMESNSACVVCGTWTRFVYPEMGPQYSLCLPNSTGFLKRMLTAARNPFVHGSVMYRSSTYRDTGYRFRDTIEDLDLWMRMSEYGQLGIVETVLYEYRCSASGLNACGRNIETELKRLCLLLAAERREQGMERTSYAEEMQRIRAIYKNVLPKEVRRATYEFELACWLLRRGQMDEAFDYIEKAADGEGRAARRAGRMMRLKGAARNFPKSLAWLIRLILHYRNASGVEPFVRYEP